MIDYIISAHNLQSVVLWDDIYVISLNLKTVQSIFIEFLLLLFPSKVPRPDKLAVHVFEVDEDVDKDEVSENSLYIRLLNTVKV